MSDFPYPFGKRPRPPSRRWAPSVHVSGPGWELLEGRALMALISSVSFDPSGQEVATIIVNAPGTYNGYFQNVYTPGYVAHGPTAGVSEVDNIRSASTAYDKAGNIIQDLVDNSGYAVQYMTYANGQTNQIDLGPRVESMSVAFNPDGTGVSDVVYEDGTYDEFTSAGGSTTVASDVVSASVAIDGSGAKLQDYVTADGVLHEISGETTSTLGTNVVSSGIAFDGNGGVVRSVVFTDGLAYQDDYAGQHLQGQSFIPVLQPYMGATSLAFIPVNGVEVASVTFGGFEAIASSLDEIQYRFVGGQAQAQYIGNLQGSGIAFNKYGVGVVDNVTPNGDAYETEVNTYVYGVLLGHGVQSISIAFDPQGNEVTDVVYWAGEYDEFDSSGGSTRIAGNVVSASVAIDRNGNKLQDYVTADGVAHEIAGGTTTTLGTNVVGISVAFDGNGGIARSVLFTDGLAYQYDYAGQHLQGQVFDPSHYNLNRLAFRVKLPGL